ncbi:hypothetical protein [uncultured Williamsia sp.]|uniref:hypothetical protein n=1 Tax=uncultured Williamsia sp. TaxID=259311 RepID=UPI0026071491|nr:hypothetical protein [uncultured Williamsia sp.]
MTLTDIMPTLRGSIPDPLDRVRWPSGSRATLDDVVVQDFSLARAARLLGTPLVFRSPTDDPIGVVVLGVSGVTTGSPHHRILCGRTRLSSSVVVDDAGMYWHEARLVGRTSVVHRHPVTLTACGVERTVDLPADLVPGDVVAIPVRIPPETPGGCRLLDRIEESPAH